MKKRTLKLVACILIIFTIFNFIVTPMFNSNYVYATRAGASTSDDDEEEAEEDDEDRAGKSASETEAEVEDSVAGKMNGIMGILTWGGRAIAVVFGALIQLETYSVLISGSASGTTDTAFISPFDIFFNKFALTNINIFQTDDVEEGSFVYSLRSNIAAVCLVTQIIAIVVLIGKTLIGLAKQFLSNIGDKKKEGRDLAEDSFISFMMVLFMDMLMLAIITFNEGFLSAWENIAAGLDMSDVMASLRSQALSTNYILGTGCCIVYIILTVQTMKFAFTYILRFITVAVLMVVAPLTPIFYSHSQAKNGGSGVFNRWFRLFTSNVMLQTIHGILYIVLVAIPLASLVESNSSVSTLDSLGACVVIVICVMYINKAEKMLRYIFGLENDVVSFSMLNNNIHNMVNRVSSTIMGGATMITDIANNGFTPAKFGDDLSADNPVTDNPLIHQTDSLPGVEGGLPGMNPATVAQTAGQVVGDLADAAGDDNNQAGDNQSGENPAMEGNGENGTNPDGQGQSPVVIVAGGQENLSPEQLEEAARNGLEEAVKQSSEENTDTQNTTETNETNETTEDINNQNINEKDIEAELEGMDVDPKDGDELAEKYDEILNKITDAKAAIESIKTEISNYKDIQQELNSKLAELEKGIGADKALELQGIVDKVVSEKGIDYLQDNDQNVIGNNTMTNEEAEYMQTYIDSLYADNGLEVAEDRLNTNNEIVSKGNEKLNDLVANGEVSGIISETTAMALMANQDNVLNGGTDLSEAILAGSIHTANEVDTESTENVNVEGKTATTDKPEMATPDVKFDNSGEIPQNLVDQALQTEFVQKVMVENAQKIKVVGGEITTEGEITGEAVAKIMKGMSEGEYSPEKYNELKEQVKQAGEEQLLQECESNFTAENAAKLTSEAGKQCVQFMAEKSIGDSISVTSQLINMGATMTVASTMQGGIVGEKSSNVVNSLQGRKAAANN